MSTPDETTPTAANPSPTPIEDWSKHTPESTTSGVPTPASTTASQPAGPFDNEDTFYAGALKRTGTLYQGAKDGMVKRSGTVTEALSGGLKRTGTLLGGAREGLATHSASIGSAASQGLQRTGTILEGAKQGVLKRTGTISLDPKASLQRTGTLLATARDGAVQRAGTFSEWAVEWSKGVYNPDRPLKATFQQVYGVGLPRTLHSISVINGRAYIFGGEDDKGMLAANDMHLVILPSSSVLEADYKAIAPRAATKDGPVPAGRRGHSAVVVENRIFIFGGQLDETSAEETGRVWVFDTFTSKWYFHDPKSDAPYPPARSLHAAVSSELPAPQQAPQQEDDVDTEYKSTTQHLTPEPNLPAADESSIPANEGGMFFIYGGVSHAQPDQILNDAWAFDISTRSWIPLPPPSGPARPGANLILSGTKIYRAGGKTDHEHLLEADYLNIEELCKPKRFRGASNKQLALPNLLSEWTSIALTAPLLGSQIALADPGDGRKFLLSIQPAAKSVTAVDVSSETGMLVLSGQAELQEGDDMRAPQQVVAVQVQYADLYGEVVRSQLRGQALFEAVGGFAVAKGTEIEEASLVAWGGKDAAGKVVDRGWMIRFQQ